MGLWDRQEWNLSAAGGTVADGHDQAESTAATARTDNAAETACDTPGTPDMIDAAGAPAASHPLGLGSHAI